MIEASGLVGPHRAGAPPKSAQEKLLSSRGTDVPSALQAEARGGRQNCTSGKGSSSPSF
ncbi:unnamed protein product [Gulo gulo]|uniref:Uncharacterized protein n=1 Tax=Gulo gulo TaxID=48420 RepID=A0A9X9M593_GULGU|nr:unnamed protein product [Gulo gulo]